MQWLGKLGIMFLVDLLLLLLLRFWVFVSYSKVFVVERLDNSHWKKLTDWFSCVLLCLFLCFRSPRSGSRSRSADIVVVMEGLWFSALRHPSNILADFVLAPPGALKIMEILKTLGRSFRPGLGVATKILGEPTQPTNQPGNQWPQLLWWGIWSPGRIKMFLLSWHTFWSYAWWSVVSYLPKWLGDSLDHWWLSYTPDGLVKMILWFSRWPVFSGSSR